VLAINGNSTLVLDGAVNNALNGTIRVNTAAAFQGTHLNIVQPNTLFSGTGSIQLNASGSDGATTSQTATLDGAGTLTMGAGTSLRGFGLVLNLPTTNNGVFTADVSGRPLRIDGAVHQNNALYTSANGGNLFLVNATVNQSGSGSIAPAPGSNAQFQNTTISGGSITSTATSRVSHNGGGTSTLSGVTINGGMDLDGNSTTFIGAPGVALAGGATVKVNTNSAFQGTHVRTSAPNTPVSGSGTLRLAASNSDGAATSLTASVSEGGGGTGSYVFGGGVSLAGFGIVNNVATTNNGTFNADITGRPLRVEANLHQNNGLYTATNGGVLLLSNAGITQAPGGVISAVGTSGDGTVASSAQLSNTTVTGGSIVSNGASHVQLNGSTSATLSGVAIVGAFDQYGGSNLYIDSPGVTLSGGATVLVNAGASFQGTHIRAGDADTVINGNGTIRLNASGSDGATTSLTAAISEDGGDAGGSYVFAPGVTVAGFGIVNSVPTINNGVFNADVNGRPLRVNGSSHQNNNLYTASNGGTLWLVSTTVTQAGGAAVRASDGSTVDLTGSRLNGGTLGSPAGGTGTTVLNSAVTLDGVTVSRQMTLNGNGTLTITGSGINLTNNALVTVNTAAAFQGTHIRTGDANTAINGNGTIRLNASNSDGATTSLTAAISEDGGDAGGSYVFAPGVTVAGFGIVNNVPTTNNGVFNADVLNRPLRIDSNTHQNNAAYAASNGGTLVVVGATVNQSGAGTITAGDASGVVLSSAAVNGGTLNAGGTGRFTINGVSTVGGVTSNTPIDIVGNAHLVVGPAGLVNNGLVIVNSNAAFAGTAFRAGAPGAAVTGAGEVRLNRSGSDGSATSGTADIEASAAGNSFSFGAGQTISGSGRLDGPVVMAGTISPGSPAGAVSFIRNDAALSFTDNGRLRIDIADGTTFDRLVNTGSVALDGTLQVVSAMDFPAGATFDVITGGSHSGQFDTVLSSGLAAPKRFGARYDNPSRVRVTVLCGPADIAGQGADGNGDGVLDNNDFIVFIDRFFANDPRADYGSTGGIPGPDGQWNNNDFVVFIDLFFAGCF
ncbi:MAG TPA: GC-type dockerin domain-anchored protein, partial [Phycisphaerales bacterium]|nr:GC-type dockerin domain-anchored protein [Phycisphaerales bacterium]